MLAVERDLAEARRRRAVDQWNCRGADMVATERSKVGFLILYL